MGWLIHNNRAICTNHCSLMNLNLDWDRSVINSKVIQRSQAKRQKADCRPEHLNLYGNSGSSVRLVHTCGMTHSYVWHDSSTCGTWLIHVCDMTQSYVGHDSSICVTWLVHVWDMTHSYVWHDLFICGTWLIHICDMTRSYVGHDSFICVTWRLPMCDMTHSHDGWLTHMCDMSHMRMRCMAWRCMPWRGGGLGSRPKKMYGERFGDGVEYHLMSPTPRR